MSKYHARRTVIGGETFDSQREALRYQALKQMQRDGEIKKLRRQVKFDLTVNGVRVGFYKCDFAYVERGKEITEDVKGFPTPVYRLKKKLMKAIYGIEIRET